jgi:GNAT superfamily N-acetyltransferase
MRGSLAPKRIKLDKNGIYIRKITQMEYKIENSPDNNKIIQFLDDRIYEFNSETINKKDGRQFSKIIREDKEIIAGIAGWIWAYACEITLLWVKEEYRKKKLGEKLLKAAEEEAIKAGCNVILIRSYAFQAPFFYEKYGYKIEYIINDFPNGYKYYILIKRI